MKKAFSLVCMFFAFALLVIGCSDPPETVAKKWGKAIIEGDLKEANKYSTEKTSSANAIYISWLIDSKQIAEKKNDYTEYLKAKEALEFKDARVEIDGDVAKIYTKDDKWKLYSDTKLKKVNGDWKVDIEK